ncbi:MAG: acyl-CoA thioesterase [Candidatus Latescibacterota bacterium]
MAFNNGRNYTTVRVRYAETDRMGIAYNSHYLTWFEVGRTEFMRELGLTYRDLEQSGFLLPLIESGIKYLKPALYDEVLTIVTAIGRKPGARVFLEYAVIHENDTIATGFTEHAFTDTVLRPTRPPRELLSAFRTAWEQTLTSDRKNI